MIETAVLAMELELSILFVDVCDSTRLYEQAGNVRAAELIGTMLGRLEEEVARVRGRVIKSLGDGLMCVFTTPELACQAAGQMMAAAARSREEGLGGNGFNLRVGIHFGSVVRNGGDVFGDAINVTARIEAMASPSEILLTEEAASRLPEALRGRCRLIDTTRVKGKTTAIRIYSLHDTSGDESSDDRTILGSAVAGGAVRGANFTLRLTYRNREKIVSVREPKLTIGRHETCDIFVQSQLASRQHGSIEFSRESFVLTDHSSNGTYIKAGDNPPVTLRRETAKLVGRGLLGIGAVPEKADQDHVVRFGFHVEM